MRNRAINSGRGWDVSGRRRARPAALAGAKTVSLESRWPPNAGTATPRRSHLRHTQARTRRRLQGPLPPRAPWGLAGNEVDTHGRMPQPPRNHRGLFDASASQMVGSSHRPPRQPGASWLKPNGAGHRNQLQKHTRDQQHTRPGPGGERQVPFPLCALRGPRAATKSTLGGARTHATGPGQTTTTSAAKCWLESKRSPGGQPGPTTAYDTPRADPVPRKHGLPPTSGTH